VQQAVGSSYEQWDGHGWPGELKGDAVPIAARLALLAEYNEVAHRIGGAEAAAVLARKRAGAQFDPALSALLWADPDAILHGLESARTWEAVIGGRARARRPAVGGAVRRRADRGRRLRRPRVALHARPHPRHRRPRRRGRGVAGAGGRGPDDAAAGRAGPRAGAAGRVELDARGAQLARRDGQGGNGDRTAMTRPLSRRLGPSI
jgi:hypothetical protein